MRKYHLLSGTGWATKAYCASGRMAQQQLFGVPFERKSEVTCTKCLAKMAKAEARRTAKNNKVN